jgi:hypothetical protein
MPPAALTDRAAIDKAVERLCGDDFFESRVAKADLEHTFTPAVMLHASDCGGVDDAHALVLATAIPELLEKALNPDAPDAARRFAVGRLEAAAAHDPAAFRASTALASMAVRIATASDETLGIADVSARALVFAAGDTDENLRALLLPLPASTDLAAVDCTALMRVATAALEMSGQQQPRPLAGGFVAYALAAHVVAAFKAEDTLLLVTLLSLALSANRFVDAAATLGADAIALICSIVKSGSDPLLLPFCLRGIGTCIARDPSPAMANTATFGPAVVAFIGSDVGAEVARTDFAAWAVAVAGLLSTPAGVAMCNAAEMRTAVSKAVAAQLRHGAHEARIAALHVVEAAAACRPVASGASPWLLAGPEHLDAAVASTAAPDAGVRAGAWRSLQSVFVLCSDAEAVGETEFLSKLAATAPAPIAPSALRRLRIVLGNEGGGTADELAVVDAAAKAGAALALLTASAKPHCNAGDWELLDEELGRRGLRSDMEMAL